MLRGAIGVHCNTRHMNWLRRLFHIQKLALLSIIYYLPFLQSSIRIDWCTAADIYILFNIFSLLFPFIAVNKEASASIIMTGRTSTNIFVPPREVVWFFERGINNSLSAHENMNNWVLPPPLHYIKGHFQKGLEWSLSFYYKGQTCRNTRI